MVRKPKAAPVEIVNPQKKTCNRHFGPMGNITVGNFPAPPYNIRLLTTADRVETCPDSDTTTLGDAYVNVIRVPIDASVRVMNFPIFPRMFNGVTWDRIRGTVAGGLLVSTKHDNKTYKTAVFDAAASGNLVAAVAAKVIKLHAMTIQAQGTVVVNLNNGVAGASLMEWSFQAREGAVIPMANAPAYWAITGVNTILYVTLSAAVQVTITAIYSDDDAS